jgi:hypothetical protein
MAKSTIRNIHRIRPRRLMPRSVGSDVDLVFNLTIPAAHVAIAAGTHFCGENPLAVTTGQAREVLAAVWRWPHSDWGAGARQRGVVDAGGEL